MPLSALVIDPAAQTISPLQISPDPNLTAALTQLIGRRPKFAWISFVLGLAAALVRSPPVGQPPRRKPAGVAAIMWRPRESQMEP